MLSVIKLSGNKQNPSPKAILHGFLLIIGKDQGEINMERLEWLLKDNEGEKETLKSQYDGRLRNICKEKGKIFEADSREDFLSARLIAMESMGFPTWNEEIDNVNAYFEDIANWIETADKKHIAEVELDQLEHWLTAKCCKINNENMYIMTSYHPMVHLIEEESKRLEDEFNNAVQGQSDIYSCIKKAVLKDYLRQKEKFLVYGTGQVYFSKEVDGYRQAIPWKDVGTLTSVDSLRLIEKTIAWIKYKKVQDIKIAYMGTLDNPDKLKKYFEEIPVPTDTGDIYGNIQFTQLKRNPQNGKYIFEIQDSEQGCNRKRIYNLSSLADMKELFNSFDIVLFLDESYFYKQRQTPKSLMEKGAADYVQWYLKESKRLTEDEKAYFYKEIYNNAGLWLNGYGQDETSKFEFDRELFNTIRQAINKNSVVYLYISQGKTIGDIKLSNQSICNDERYDGKRLLVYKMIEKEDADTENNVKEAVCRLLEGKDGICASIDLWKLMKSIGKEFYQDFFSLWGVSEDNKAIDCLKSSYLFINISKPKEGQSADAKPKLQFSLYLHEEIENQTFLEELVRDYLEICAEDENAAFSYARNYLFELFINAMVSRANSAKGIFYAYLLEKGVVRLTKDEIASINRVEEKPNIKPCKSQAKRAVYSAVKGLDQVLIRDMERRMNILKYEFRHIYCSDIDENTFIQLLYDLNDFCREMGYTDSKLYLLTQK